MFGCRHQAQQYVFVPFPEPLYLKNITVLKLEHCRFIAGRFDHFVTLSKLEEFTIRRSNLRVLSDELIKLTKLKTIIINDCKVCFLNVQVSAFHGKTKLVKTPSSLSRLLSLKVLDVKENYLKTIVSVPPGLMSLDVSRNKELMFCFFAEVVF